MSEQQVYFAIGGIVAGWLFAIWFRGSGKQSADLDKIEERIGRLELSAAEVVVKVTPMWAKVEKQISDDLHKPHEKYKEMDTLLEQLEALTINAEGTARLKELLIERSNDMSEEITESERQSAAIMGTVMDKVLEESKYTGALENVELVGEFKPNNEEAES